MLRGKQINIISLNYHAKELIIEIYNLNVYKICFTPEMEKIESVAVSLDTMEGRGGKSEINNEIKWLKECESVLVQLFRDYAELTVKYENYDLIREIYKYGGIEILPNHPKKRRRKKKAIQKEATE